MLRTRHFAPPLKRDMDMGSTTAFNAAINFALDHAEGDGLIFLAMWREGDWEGIAHAFPSFDLETTGQVKVVSGRLILR